MNDTPKRTTRDYLCRGFICLVFIVLLARCYAISSRYPYYFMWDMDWVTSLDTVLIHSDLLPDHLGHPGFGMYLLQHLTEKTAHSLGALSALSLSELENSLNPLASMVEITEFLRLHSPFLAVGIVLLLWTAVCRLFDMPRWQQLLMLLVLATQSSLLYHSSMIRTDFYAVFYWSIAVVIMSLALRTGNSLCRSICLIGSGLALGLAFLTKIQVFFLLALFPILLALLFSFSLSRGAEDHRPAVQKRNYLSLALGGLNLAVFLLLAVFSYRTNIPGSFATFAKSYGITHVAVLFLIAFVTPVLVQTVLLVKARASSETFRLFHYFNIVGTGFLLAFACHFLIYSDLDLSWRYLLYDCKILFFRQNFYGSKKMAAAAANIAELFRYSPTQLIVFVGFSLSLLAGGMLKLVRLTKKEIVLVLLMTLVVLAHVSVGTRPILRDLLWWEIALSFGSLLWFGVLVTRTVKYRSILSVVATVALGVLLVVNCGHQRSMPQRIDANFNRYGWQPDRWLRHVYPNNQSEYSKVILRKYDRTTIKVAQDRALDQARIRNTVDFVFPNQNVTHRNIGIAFAGFPVWTADLGYRIADVPSWLRGSITIDNGALPRKKTGRLLAEHVRKHSEKLDKLKPSAATTLLSVLTRPDLKVLMFVPKEDIPALLSKNIVQTPHKITVRKGKELLELDGLLIDNYSEINVDSLQHRFFFVIQGS